MICTRCLYDDKTPGISFGPDGVCNYCKVHDKLCAEYPIGLTGFAKISELCRKIKKEGEGKKYDVVVGVSGGCDSSYLLYLTKQWGLRPLAVNFDNTWSTPVSFSNLDKMMEGLSLCCEDYRVNAEEYDDIYRAFLSAEVPDLEAPTDVAIATILYRAAEKYDIKYIFDAHCFRTEGISPLGWLYFDGKYIQSVYGKEFKTFPNLWLSDFLRWTVIKRIKRIRPLYYMDYRRDEAKSLLTEKFGWEDYGEAHHENDMTNFYHQHFMPRKFGIDQRVTLYSAQVRSGHMSRKEGLWQSKKMILNDDLINRITKRLGPINLDWIGTPKKTYKDFKTYKKTFERLKPLFWILMKMDLVPKSFYQKYTAKGV